MADNHSGDIMSSMPGNQQNTTSSSTASNSGGPDIELLKSIDSTLKTILREGPRWSQSDAQNMMPGRRYAQSSTRTGYSNDEKWGNSRSRKGYKSDGTEFKGVFDEFEDGLRDALMEGLFGADLKGSMQATLEALENYLKDGRISLNCNQIDSLFLNNLSKKTGFFDCCYPHRFH